MRRLSKILSLPASVLLLIAVSSWQAVAEPQWPHNLPAHQKYFPEDEIHVKRGLHAIERLASQSPVGVRKMSGDRHEMFFLDYWQFEDPKDSDGLPFSPINGTHRLLKRSVPADQANTTLENNILPPLLLHTDNPNQQNWQDVLRFYPRSNLVPRDFKCPTGTTNCSSISAPNSCCATDETCIHVDNLDNTMGDVGCCPKGATCNGQIASCDTANGFTSCPDSPNGGCCIPNYSCQGVGCVSGGTTTTTTTLPVVTVTTCTSGWHTCPASLGGGCCQNGADCGSSNHCTTTSSSSSAASTSTTTTTASTSTTTSTASPGTTAIAPLRGTGSTNTNEAVSPSSTITSGTTLIAVCPTGYYFCSAYYRPGCCQVGLNCALSNCPAASSSTRISNGITVVVPVGSSTGGSSYESTAIITNAVAAGSTFKNGACPAGGWTSCAATVGGGCCPPTYGCGDSTTCLGTSGATGVVNKVAPSLASGRVVDFFGILWLVVSVCLGSGMVLL